MTRIRPERIVLLLYGLLLVCTLAAFTAFMLTGRGFWEAVAGWLFCAALAVGLVPSGGFLVLRLWERVGKGK